MTPNPRDALASTFETYSIERRLHAVPPHEVYEVTVAGRRAVCKVAAGPEADPAMEGRIVERVGTHTDLPVPEVLTVGEDFFVAGWLDGLPEAGGPDDLDAAYARALGRALARLHAGTADLFGASGLLDSAGTDLVHDPGTWPETVRAFLRRRRAYLADIGYAGVADAVLDLLADRPGLLGAAGDPVVCHGNVLPDHVGFEGADGARRLTALVDFEHALVGPPTYDLWRTLLPVFGPDAVEEGSSEFAAFRRGYEVVRPFPPAVERDAAVYRLVNAVSYLRALHLQNGGFGPDERERAERLADSVRESVAALRDAGLR